MVYPTLPADADAVSIFEIGLSPSYDITWSVTYYIEDLTPGDEIGLCMFLQDATQPLSGGGVGIDLGYSGLSADNLSYPTSVGMLSAVVGIGLDSTGQFPLSVQWPDGTKRDGLNVTDRVLNSASIRGSYPNYSYLSGSNTEITEFDIADSQKKTLRARLGNYGRTIYLDYKRADDDSFTNILTKDVNIPFSETTRFRPGVSITKPISANATPNNQIVIEAFHIEGIGEDPTNIDLPFTPTITACDVDTTILCWSVDGMPRATLSGSANDGAFSSVYNLSGSDTTVTLTWNGLSSAWFLDTNDNIHEYELISTQRCDPTGIIRSPLNTFTITRDSCNFTPCEPDTTNLCWSLNGTPQATLSGSVNAGLLSGVYDLSGSDTPVTLTWSGLSSTWFLDINDGVYEISTNRCNPAGFIWTPLGRFNIDSGSCNFTPCEPDTTFLCWSIGGSARATLIGSANDGLFSGTYDLTGAYGLSGSDTPVTLTWNGLSSAWFLDINDGVYEYELISTNRCDPTGTIQTLSGTFAIDDDICAFIPCERDITELCWSIDGIPEATLSGSALDGSFSGVYDLSGSDTPVTLTWNSLSSAWFLDANDDVYEISTNRCNPTNIVWTPVGRFTIKQGSCNFTPCEPDTTNLCWSIDGIPEATLTGSVNAGLLSGVYNFPGSVIPVTLTWNGLSSAWFLDINDGVYEYELISTNRCDPTGRIQTLSGTFDIDSGSCNFTPCEPDTTFLCWSVDGIPRATLSGSANDRLFSGTYGLSSVTLTWNSLSSAWFLDANDNIHEYELISTRRCDPTGIIQTLSGTATINRGICDFGCQPNITELCWSLGGVPQATLTGSANDGLFSGVYDLFGFDTPVTLIWDPQRLGWYLNTNDGVYEDELISTNRCDPTGSIDPLLAEFTITRGSCIDEPPPDPEPPLPPDPRPPRSFDKVCGETLSGALYEDQITTVVYRISGGTGPVTITYNLSTPPLSSINTSLSTTSYEFETTPGAEYGQLSVNILSSHFDDFNYLRIYEGSTVKFENLDSVINSEVLTVVGFNNYPYICTLWVNESAADGLSISASVCQEYVSAFTMILTGDYSFAGSPSGYQHSPSNNELYELFDNFENLKPVRFNVEYDDQTIYETGYVGSEEYSYNGSYRQEFINAILSGTNLIGFTTSDSLTAGLSASQIAADGYPLVTSALTGSTVFQKETDTTRLNVTIYDILTSRNWTFDVSCPCFELYPFTINWCTSAWVTDPLYPDPLSCSDPGYWSINSNGSRIRFNVADSTNCGGNCNGVQHGKATAIINVTSPINMYLAITGIGEQQDFDFEQISFKLNDVLIAQGASIDKDLGCTMGPISTNYIVDPPYGLLEGFNELVIDFTTADELYHLSAYYEVDLSFDPVGDTDVRHWQRLNCDVASQLSAVEDCVPDPPDPEPCPKIDEVCITFITKGTGGISKLTYIGNIEDGIYQAIDDNGDFIDGAFLEWDVDLLEWFITDPVIPGSDQGSGSKERCDPDNKAVYNSERWTATVDTTGPCPPLPVGPCDPEYTRLCLTLAEGEGFGPGAELSILNGGTNAGLFAGVWDNFGEETPVTITWNGAEWILNMNDGVYENEIVSTERCNPCGGVNVLLGQFRVSVGNCDDPCDPITDVCVTVTVGGVPGSETLTGNIEDGFIGEFGASLFWSTDFEEWVFDDGVTPVSSGGSLCRCNPAGDGYTNDFWTAVVTIGVC